MTEEKKQKLASRLALARKQAGLTQGQVANLLDIHRPSLSEIEAGRRNVSATELARLAEIYGVSVSWLVGDIDRSPPEDQIELAARELAKLSEEDLDRVLNLLSSIRQSK